MEQEVPARQPGPPGSERRVEPRFPSSQRLACYPAGSGLAERRQVRLRNVSRSGIGMVVDRAWHAGTVLLIELPGEDGVKTVRARVVHATRQVSGTYLVGCNFETPLGDADVQALSR